MYLVSVWGGKLLLKLLRLTGQGGAALPGLIVERIYPRFLNRVAKQLGWGAILVTGTNGKTTTTKLIAGMLEAEGHLLVRNRSGSNMSRGIVSAFLEHVRWSGRLRQDMALFEVDEAFMGDVAAKLRPRVVVVLNLLRDQLDRYGELDRTAELIAAGLKYTQQAVLNADDPLVAQMAGAVNSGSALFFGAVPELKVQLPHDEQLHQRPRKRPVAKRTGAPTSKLNLLLTKTKLTPDGQRFTYEYAGRVYQARLQLPGIYNAYNAAAALTCVTVVGLALTRANASIVQVPPAFGRSELVEVGGRQLRLLLVKNPAGFNQIISTFLVSRPAPTLMAVNDNFADGRDVSWLWDVDFEALSSFKPALLVTGIRAYDLAVRLKYADITCSAEPALDKALRTFIKQLAPGDTGYIVPSYTAMVGLRKLLAKQADIKEVWE
ncbi:DUF1727 domain-containing protein [Candidatus Microgenomates bacterium]|nr:DUF1727 domain-containing protein [Candidatus Microgenomates bacterium]